MNHSTDAGPQSATLHRSGLLLRVLGQAVLAFLLVLVTLWAAAALHFDVRVPWLGTPLAAAYLIAVLALWILAKGKWLQTGLTVGAFALVLAWWFMLEPSNDRNWQPDVEVLAIADIQGNRIKVQNIRNCDYRTKMDFDVRYYDKTFDLQRLCTADLYMVYWGSPNIALCERGSIATNVPLAELKQQAHIHTRARTADKEADFSRLIRLGVVGIEQPTLMK
jgi:hypothetical protein